MFFQEDQINKALICSHCTEKFVDPRMLPCGETYCDHCILEIVNESPISNNDKFKCAYCGSIHQLAKNGFPVSKRLAVLLEQHPDEVWRSENVKNLKECLELIQSKLQNLKTQHSTPLIQEHCSDLRNQIDLQTDTLKNQLDNQRDQLFAKIDKYEQDCLGNVEKIQKDGEYLKLVEEMGAFRTQWVEYLKGFKIEDKEISRALKLSYDNLKSIEQFDEERRLELFLLFNSSKFNELKIL